jgi:hypothetical protein
MRNVVKMLVVALTVLGAVPVAAADDTQAPASATRQPGMMQGQGMMGQDGMPGMMGMMRMMQQMGPMMERCAAMMAAMTDRMESAPDRAEPQDDNG